MKLEQLLKQQNKPVADNGFTDRVMSQIESLQEESAPWFSLGELPILEVSVLTALAAMTYGYWSQYAEIAFEVGASAAANANSFEMSIGAAVIAGLGYLISSLDVWDDLFEKVKAF